MKNLKQVKGFELKIKDERKLQVQEARERIAKGKFISHTEILKEFDVQLKPS